MRVAVFLLAAAILVAGCSGAKPTKPAADVQPPKDIDFQDEDDVVVEDPGCGSPDTGLILTVREPGGFPLHGYPVSLIGTEHGGTTDQEGRVRFVNLTAGPLVVRVTPQDHWYKVTQANVTVRTGCMLQASLIMPLKDGYLTPPHVHDDWRGRTSFELFSMEFDVDCVFVPFQGRCVGPDGQAPSRITFPTPVPPGTGWVNITADFEATGTVAYMMVQINRPQVTGTNYRLAPGVPHSFSDEHYTLADTPHATSSRWTFSLVGTPGFLDPPVLVQGPVMVRVEVAKSPRPLTIDPPHPDFWGDRTQVRLTDQGFSWAATQAYYDDNPSVDQLLAFDPGQLVFPGTREVVFTAWINETVDRDQPMELWYAMQTHARVAPSADDYRRVVGETTDGVRHDWRIEVAPDEYDNLYFANQTYFDPEEGHFPFSNAESKWRFHVRPSSVSADAYVVYTGEADIHLIATAYKL